MQERGIDFEVVSTETTVFDEVTYQANTIARTINDVDLAELEDFDGLMIVSGNMADTELYWKHEKVLEFVRLTDKQEKPIAAICCSVPTIREAARDKKVSFFPLVRSRQLLSNAGAILQTVALTVDGRLVTAEHQMASQMWANAFSDVLLGVDPDVRLVDSGYVPKGRERKPIPIVEKIRKIQEGKSD
jgi:putative intracellular protease/amidase